MTIPLDKVRQLEGILIDRATGGNPSSEEYSKLRLELLRDSTTKDLLPQFVEINNELDKFWSFIKLRFKHY
ncbi:MAG: hypothetical protein R6U67_02840, partial [Sodalinema sp.]|uniref:hypothetical protein n=1 Tax=Sodalinema sp. TaxID=3080550 RepID=UPI00396F54F2